MTWKDIIYYAQNGSPKPDKIIVKSDAEWQKQLTEEQYRVTRQKGTERPFTGELCSSYEHGEYNCVCCNTSLFDSSIKFNSSSGWPSFKAPIAENTLAYIKDATHGMIRVEAICNVCDAHLGHVFPDGPQPSGLRFCINSAAIQLKKTDEH
jgi:peptide-methionine (R)-S-oxide reductase